MTDIRVVKITIERDGVLEEMSVGDTYVENVDGYPRVKIVGFVGGPDVEVQGVPETEFSGCYHNWPPSGLTLPPPLEQLAEAAE